jgi:hypothetical protein
MEGLLRLANVMEATHRTLKNVNTVLFNDEDFHSVEILETVVRQSEMLAHKKKWLLCKVTPVSIQAFVEG